MNAEVLLRAIPGALLVALFALPAFLLIRGSFLVALNVAIVVVFAGLSALNLSIGHGFAFWRPEDVPVLVGGIAVAAAVGRLLVFVRRKKQGIGGGEGIGNSGRERE